MRQDRKRIFKLISRAEALEKNLCSVTPRVLGHEYVAVDESLKHITNSIGPM